MRLLNEKPSTSLVIVDESIIWYGNLSPIGYQDDETASLLWLESTDVAKEFLAMYEKASLKSGLSQMV